MICEDSRKEKKKSRKDGFGDHHKEENGCSSDLEGKEEDHERGRSRVTRCTRVTTKKKTVTTTTERRSQSRKRVTTSAYYPDEFSLDSDELARTREGPKPPARSQSLYLVPGCENADQISSVSRRNAEARRNFFDTSTKQEIVKMEYKDPLQEVSKMEVKHERKEDRHHHHQLPVSSPPLPLPSENGALRVEKSQTQALIGLSALRHPKSLMENDEANSQDSSRVTSPSLVKNGFSSATMSPRDSLSRPWSTISNTGSDLEKSVFSRQQQMLSPSSSEDKSNSLSILSKPGSTVSSSKPVWAYPNGQYDRENDDAGIEAVLSLDHVSCASPDSSVSIHSGVSTAKKNERNAKEVEEGEEEAEEEKDLLESKIREILREARQETRPESLSVEICQNTDEKNDQKSPNWPRVIPVTHFRPKSAARRPSGHKELISEFVVKMSGRWTQTTVVNCRNVSMRGVSQLETYRDEFRFVQYEYFEGEVIVR